MIKTLGIEVTTLRESIETEKENNLNSDFFAHIKFMEFETIIK